MCVTYIHGDAPTPYPIPSHPTSSYPILPSDLGGKVGFLLAIPKAIAALGSLIRPYPSPSRWG